MNIITIPNIGQPIQTKTGKPIADPSAPSGNPNVIDPKVDVPGRETRSPILPYEVDTDIYIQPEDGSIEMPNFDTYDIGRSVEVDIGRSIKSPQLPSGVPDIGRSRGFDLGRPSGATDTPPELDKVVAELKMELVELPSGVLIYE